MTGEENLSYKEQLKPERLKRWQKLWKPYSELTEAEKTKTEMG
jgi:hypothetical protein